jgi:hypothetical protein
MIAKLFVPTVMLIVALGLFWAAGLISTPCAWGACAGSCSPQRGLFCSGVCACFVTTPDGWGVCQGPP